MKRNAVLATAGELINGDRADDYGSAYDNHMRIAQIWSALIDVELSPEQVAMMMIGLKLSRLANSPDKIDSWVDICGYGALGGEMSNETKNIRNS